MDILAITFTKNAANEMLDRLILVADKSGEYAGILHDKKKKKAEKESTRRHFVRKFKWIGGLTVRTFHSFGYYLLRNYGVLFLYRRTKMMHPFFEGLKKEGLSVPYKTIHAAKGLEARVVFIVGLIDGFGGFPDIWLEDRIFQVVKKANLDLLLEEERRLFYVALTRAKDKLFLITEKGRESSFLKEIPEAYTVRTGIPFQSIVEEVRLCPLCYSQLEKMFAYCPYCGGKQGDEPDGGD